VFKGALVTPPLYSSVLAGITRDSVIKLARELEIPVREDIIPREQLYLADELFYAGTAVEISPIASVDKIPIGGGKVGPITKALQDAKAADRHGWLTAVPQPAAARSR
jgi:branched-chain amino acid aminotransferase